jgi:hypothetical protein
MKRLGKVIYETTQGYRAFCHSSGRLYEHGVSAHDLDEFWLVVKKEEW